LSSPYRVLPRPCSTPPLPCADDSEGAAACLHLLFLLRRLAEEFRTLPWLPEPDRAPGNRVMGCVARVWLAARRDGGARCTSRPTLTQSSRMGTAPPSSPRLTGPRPRRCSPSTRARSRQLRRQPSPAWPLFPPLQRASSRARPWTLSRKEEEDRGRRRWLMNVPHLRVKWSFHHSI
jgi:hypothetical protein